MNVQLLIGALGSLVAAFAGVAAGIVGLRKMGTDKAVSVSSIANASSEAALAGLSSLNDALQKAYEAQAEQLTKARLELVTVHDALHVERNAHMRAQFMLAEANDKLDELGVKPPRPPRKRTAP